ncbi:hypothetical protein GEV49_37190 [Streptomyces sp. SYP-A7193]|nr:hypothetical protein GEV49_37190 [Streptomyces sp. SYP-A7193]
MPRCREARPLAKHYSDLVRGALMEARPAGLHTYQLMAATRLTRSQVGWDDGDGVEEDLLLVSRQCVRLRRTEGETGHEQPQAAVLEELELDDSCVGGAPLRGCRRGQVRVLGAEGHASGAPVPLGRGREIRVKPRPGKCCLGAW